MSRVFRWVFSWLILLGLVGAIIFRQSIIDQFSVWSYQPTDSIASLVSRSGMSGSGKFHFYLAQPQLEPSSQFNDECRRAERASPVLGCYDQSTSRIHIYNTTNPELDGIKEVTAAHEMLHVVFARTSSDEIKKLTPLLEAAYQRLKTPELERRMAYYDRYQPGSRVNELHSIIGTEFTEIGDELEDYYQKFFDDRQKVVALHAQYSQKFESIEQEIERLSSSLDKRRGEINSDSDNYTAGVAMYNSRVNNFNYRARNSSFSSQAEFDNERRLLQDELSRLNSQRLQLQAVIDKYNQDVARLNELGVKMNQLSRSLDSLEGLD